MSRTEWWALVCIGLGQLITLIGILLYVRFIWDVQQKIWHQMWMSLCDDPKTTAELHLGDIEDGERRSGQRDLYRSER